MVPFHKIVVNHGWTMVKTHGWTMVNHGWPWFNHGFFAEAYYLLQNILLSFVSDKFKRYSVIPTTSFYDMNQKM